MKYFNTYQEAKAAYPDADAVLVTGEKNSEGSGLFIPVFSTKGIGARKYNFCQPSLFYPNMSKVYFSVCNPSDYEEDMNIDDIETKPQPKTVVEYEEADSLHAALDDFESMSGIEFYPDCEGKSDRINSVRQLALAYGNCSLYRRTERPAEWWEVCEFPVLCRVWDDDSESKYVVPVQSAREGDSIFLFCDDADVRWENATPLTRAEIQTFMDNAVE